jgi:hypothetical protein
VDLIDGHKVVRFSLHAAIATQTAASLKRNILANLAGMKHDFKRLNKTLYE